MSRPSTIPPHLKKQSVYNCYRRHYLSNDEYRKKCRTSNKNSIKAIRHYERDLKKNDPMLHIAYCAKFLYKGA